MIRENICEPFDLDYFRSRFKTLAQGWHRASMTGEDWHQLLGIAPARQERPGDEFLEGKTHETDKMWDHRPDALFADGRSGHRGTFADGVGSDRY